MSTTTTHLVTTHPVHADATAAVTPAIRTAHDNLAELAMMPWPHDPIPEVLARAEALVPLLHLLDPTSPAADHILHQLRQDGRALAEVDSFGMLTGPIRDRYLALIAAVSL